MNKQTHKYREHCDGCQRGGVGGLGEKREGIKMCKSPVIKSHVDVMYSIGIIINNIVEICMMSDGY